MSSRNVYLSSDERKDALVLNRALKKGVGLIGSGVKDASEVITELGDMISEVKTARIDYISIVDENMKDVKTVQNGNILALAVFIGRTRLIDNHIIGEKICY
jgi:pantoate--beta-alanine ligase